MAGSDQMCLFFDAYTLQLAAQNATVLVPLYWLPQLSPAAALGDWTAKAAGRCKVLNVVCYM